MGGWFKVWRDLTDSPLWLKEKFTRGQAWLDLFGLANHRDGFIFKRGIHVPVLRGQCGWSQDSLSCRWGWSRGKTDRFLNWLESEQNIVQQKNRLVTIITICNYERYQGADESSENKNDTTNSTTNGQQIIQQTDTNKKEKKVKKNKKVIKGKNSSTKKPLPDMAKWIPSKALLKWAKSRGFCKEGVKIYAQETYDWCVEKIPGEDVYFEGRVRTRISSPYNTQDKVDAVKRTVAMIRSNGQGDNHVELEVYDE